MSDIFERGAYRWGEVLARRPRTVRWAAVLLGVLALPFAVYVLRHLDADIFNQVSDQLPRFQVLRELSRDFGGELFAAVVSIPEDDARDPARVGELRDFGALLAHELAGVGTRPEDAGSLPADAAGREVPAPWLRQVQDRTDQGTRDAIVRLVQDHPHLVLGEAHLARVRQLFTPEALSARLKALRGELQNLDPLSVERQRLLADPLGLGRLGEDALKERLQAYRKGIALEDAQGCFLSPDGTTLLVLARPVRGSQDLVFDRALMAAAQRAENRALEAFRQRQPAPLLGTSLKGERFTNYAPGEDPAPALRVGFTGMHALAVENEFSLRSDVFGTTATSALSVLVIFLLVFGSLRLAGNFAITMGLAVVLTLALAGILHGRLGILGAGCSCIVIGMGVDYGVHIHGTYHALRLAGWEPARALRETVGRCGPAILAAALTSVVAFGGIATTHFSALAKLGLLAALGLAISAVLMLSLFPLLAQQSVDRSRLEAPFRGLGLHALGRFLAGRRVRTLGLAASVLVVLAGLWLWLGGPGPRLPFAAPPPVVGPGSKSERFLGVRFDGDLGNLRSLRVQAIPLRDRVQARFHLSFADLGVIVEAADEGRALAAAEEVQARMAEYVARGEVTPGGGMLELAPGLGRQEPVLAAFRALDLDGCAQAFLKAAQGEFGGGAERAFQPFLERLHEFAAKARQARPVTLAELLDGPLGTLASLYARVDESAAGRRVRLVSYYFPARPDFSAEWYAGLAHRLEDQPLAASTVRVTAARMVGLELKDSLIHDLEWISAVVGILVLVMAYVAVRSVTRTLLAALPLAFSLLFVLAGVGLAERAGWNFSLNFVNLMIFPILLGSAIDYGIYMVMDVFSARRPTLPQLVALTGRSVVLCALTTLGGFGSMIWGRNTGMISFGWAAILGYSGALFAALIVLPLLLGCLGVGTEAAAEEPQAPGAPVQAGRTDAPER